MGSILSMSLSNTISFLLNLNVDPKKGMEKIKSPVVPWPTSGSKRWPSPDSCSGNFGNGTRMTQSWQAALNHAQERMAEEEAVDKADLQRKQKWLTWPLRVRNGESGFGSPLPKGLTDLAALELLECPVSCQQNPTLLQLIKEFCSLQPTEP